MRRYDISFVIPMYNEEANIGETLLKLSALAGRICGSYEILIVDDASTDGSPSVVSRMAEADPRIRLIRLGANTRFGGALNEGLINASKDVILYTDSDLPVREEDMTKALELLDNADIVTGYSLVIKDWSLKRIIISKGYNFLVRLLFDIDIKDINSGFKIYRKKAIEGLKFMSKSPFIDAEIFAEAIRTGARIRQYGLIFDLRTKGRSNIARSDVILRSFWDMFVYRFSR
jgi:glycosyltransferase involved in cell wall biosynthesis